MTHPQCPGHSGVGREVLSDTTTKEGLWSPLGWSSNSRTQEPPRVLVLVIYCFVHVDSPFTLAFGSPSVSYLPPP